MACSHRFLGLHTENTLFPDWEIDHLFIGTFNPEWDRTNASNAGYFYGRSKYFWDAVSIFFEDKLFEKSNFKQPNIIELCKSHRIGFTDLISTVVDADILTEEHRSRIYSVKDTELEKFDNIDWNTERIIDFLQSKRPAHIYFTLLSSNTSSIFTKEIQKIESAAKHLPITADRLHSPTGANLGSGTPRLHQLVERWNLNSNLPKIDLSKYPYELNFQKTQKGKATARVSSSTIINDRYKLSIDVNGKPSSWT